MTMGAPDGDVKHALFALLALGVLRLHQRGSASQSTQISDANRESSLDCAGIQSGDAPVTRGRESRRGAKDCEQKKRGGLYGRGD